MKSENKDVKEKATPSRARKISNSSIKPIFLSIFLIILPIMFYWYVQIQNQQNYEQDRIYRTLRELQLHINKELNAINQLEKVLPLENILRSNLSILDRNDSLQSAAEKNQFGPCSSLLLAETQLPKRLEIKNDSLDRSCPLPGDLLKETKALFEGIEESTRDNDNELLELLSGLSSERQRFTEERRDDFYAIYQRYQPQIDKQCSEASGNQSQCYSWQILKQHNLELKQNTRFAEVYSNAANIYQACSPKVDNIQSQRSTKSRGTQDLITRYCLTFEAEFQESLDDFIYSSGKEPKDVNDYQQVTNDFIDAVDIVFNLVDTLLYIAQKAFTGDSGESPQEITKKKSSRFIDLAINPYQKIISNSQMCIFVSEQNTNAELPQTMNSFILERAQLVKLFAQDVQACQKVLNGKQLVLVRKKIDPTNIEAETSVVKTPHNDGSLSPSSEPQLWIAVGIDSILSRYRQSLTYLQDIYIVGNKGEVLSSFLSANKQTTTDTSDKRINSFQPVIAKINHQRIDKKENTSEKAQKLSIQDLKTLPSNEFNASNPAWSYQVNLSLEGKEFSAMVKPTDISLPLIAHSHDTFPLNSNNQLLLIGLKPANHFNLLTDRLSPLFHLTVLFVALLLLLGMPVIHVVLSRKYNSYAPFTISLFKVSLALSMIVTVVGLCSYYTMLKQNIYSADLLRMSADKLIADWEKERNASIEFLTQTEKCVFNPAMQLLEAVPEECPDYYQPTSLTAYSKYRKAEDQTKENLLIDSYVFDAKGTFSMMGLVFYTDNNGIKQQPDWMARDFVPIKNRGVDLSQRQYFKKHRDQQSWSLSINNTQHPYYIERIYNYIDGRKVTQLSIPRSTQSLEENTNTSSADFTGILSGEIMAISLESPILPPSMKMAVIEKSSGKVLFHSEKERVLVENFFDEMDKSEALSHAIKLGSEAMEMIVYRSKKLIAYTKPIPNSDWSLILLYESAVEHSVVNEVAVSVIMVLITLVTVVGIAVALIHQALRWLSNKTYNKQKLASSDSLLNKVCRLFVKPIILSLPQYLIIISIFALVFFIIYNKLTTEKALVVVFIYFLLNLYLFLRAKVKFHGEKIKVGYWLRTNPWVLTYLLLILIGLPSISLFIRWYDISTHQLQAYDYLQIQKQLGERKKYITNYRDVLWYNDDDNKHLRWLDSTQQSLGLFLDLDYQSDKTIAHYKGLNSPLFNKQETNILEPKISNAKKPTTQKNTTLKIVAELDTSVSKNNQPLFLNKTAKTCLIHDYNHDYTHEQWRSIPPLSHISKIAYHIDGQHCSPLTVAADGDSSKSNLLIFLDVMVDSLLTVWKTEFTPSTIPKTHRMTRLEMSQGIVYLLILVLIFVVFLYARQLVSGIWNKDWMSQIHYFHRKASHDYSPPRHRLFINPEASFIDCLIQKVQLSKQSIGQPLNTNQLLRVKVFFDVDLLTLNNNQRQQLLEELELCANDPKQIIWMTADVSPLYRLLKSQAYPIDNQTVILSQSEILRWAKLFSQFFKDYHCGKASDLDTLMKQPLLAKTNKSIPSALESEISAFQPDLLWIWDLVDAQQINQITKEDAIDLCSIYAGPYYRFKWEECTLDERLVLYQVARGRFPSPKNDEVIGHLIRRGYLKAKPFLRIANKSFKEFIKTAELQDTFDEWQAEAEKSSWQHIRIYIGVIILLILAWLAYTSQDTYQQIAYIIGSLLTVFTALTQGASLLKLSGKSSGSSE